MDDALQALESGHLTWRQHRLEALCAPDGWLTVVDLVWLDDGRHEVGSAPGSAVQVAGLPARLGWIEIVAGRAIWHPEGGSAVPLASDRDGPPAVVRHGRISFFLIEREQGLGVRVRDTGATRRQSFAGIPAWPFDAAWRILGDWDGETAGFVLSGQACRLRPQNPAAAQLHFVFADATSGPQSYGGGRFLYADRPGDARILLDFNRAINPPCAFTPFAVCPLPPPENRLPVAVTAGEQTYR